MELTDQLPMLVDALRRQPHPPALPRTVMLPDTLDLIRQVLYADEVIFDDLTPDRSCHWAQSGADPEARWIWDLEEFDRTLDDRREFFRLFRDAEVGYGDRTGDRNAVRIGADLGTVRERRELPMNGFYRSLGIECADTLNIWLPSEPGHSRKVRIHRMTPPYFTETDRALASLLRPFLVEHLRALDFELSGAIALTSRQRRLLDLLTCGYTNSQMARTLGISAGTVRTHLQHLYRRLDVCSRGEAVAMAGEAVAVAEVRTPQIGTRAGRSWS